MAKIVALDFDGVIHSYTSGWQGARVIPDPPVAGAIEWITQFIEEHCTVPDSICAMAPQGRYQLVIFSSRSRYFGARSAMKKWLVDNGLDGRYLEVIQFPLFKPPAVVTIDDRVICFSGVFPEFEEVINFQPWTRRKGQS